jgi:hypothetical protein
MTAYTADEIDWYSGRLPLAPLDDRCQVGRDEANCPMLGEQRRLQRMGFENYTIRREIVGGKCRLTQMVDGHDCLGYWCPGAEDGWMTGKVRPRKKE